MSDKRERILRIEIPGADVTKPAPDPQWAVLDGLNGWQVTIPGSTILHWEGTIDLSGYARDYKTFFPSGGVIQRGPFMTEAGGSGSITYTIVSSTPFAAGVGGEQQNWSTVLFAESEVNITNASLTPNPLGIQQVLERNQSGSLSPTASQVLYVYKMVAPLASAGVTRMTIPASRVILPGFMDQEPELEYMMRLSRSIELANQV